MLDGRDPREVLGLGPDAGVEEVHAAWRRLCAIYHPDRYQDASAEVRDEAERRMAEANVAYRLLLRSQAPPPPSVPPASVVPTSTPRPGAEPQLAKTRSGAAAPTQTRAPVAPSVDRHARAWAIVVFVVLVGAGVAGFLIYGHATYMTTATAFDPATLQVASAPVRCHGAIEERSGDSAADTRAAQLAVQEANGQATASQATAVVSAVRSACKKEADHRYHTAVWILVGGILAGCVIAEETYKRLR